MYLFSEFSLLPLLVLLALWAVGGYLIVSRFELPTHERGLVGLGVGLTISTFFANLQAYFLPATLAFWSGAILTILLGLVLSWPIRFTKDELRITNYASQGLLFLLSTFIFTLIGRGLGFFDDHQNLTMVSLLATGDLPLHFAFNPELHFGYHYFLLLVAAQFVRLAQAGPWAALDLARGLTLALTLFYGGFLAYRLTKSALAQTASMVFMAFAGGARWIFLLLPLSLQRQISSQVQLIGSGADTGPNLIAAIYKAWKIEGVGPLPPPFMFGSGLDPSFSMFHNGWGTSAVLLVLLLILLTGHRKNWRSDLPLVIILASLALANEVTFAFLYLGFGIAALIWIIQKRTSRLPRSLWIWIGILFAAGVLALLQGGMFTEILRTRLSPPAASQDVSYFKVSFALVAPHILSAHLGDLSLLNPLHWLPILGEVGLAALALPWVLAKLIPLSRDENWLESAFIASAVVALLTIFIAYTGNAGPTALSRMTAHFLTVLKIYAVPLLWLWLINRPESFKVTALGWGLASILSGMALFGLNLTAMPNPIYAIYLDQLDGQMFTRQWDQLEPKTMVFDPVYPRAVTVLGRPIRSSITMGENLPEWLAFEQNPDPVALHAAGYGYLYVDLKYFTKYADIIQQDCVKLLDRVDDQNNGQVVDARLLFDLRYCP